MGNKNLVSSFSHRTISLSMPQAITEKYSTTANNSLFRTHKWEYDPFRIEWYQHHGNFSIQLKENTHKIVLIASIDQLTRYESCLEELVGNIPAGEFNLFYFPSAPFQIKLNASQGNLLVISFDIHHWFSWLPREDEYRKQIQQAILLKTPVSIFSNNQKLFGSLKSIIQDIRQNAFTGAYLEQYINAKILELMVCVVQPPAMVTHPTIDLPDEEVEKMYKAKSIILSNISQPCSIITLAQQVGTNECYLKRNFKKVFGDTVYQYMQQERMEKAKNMLLNTNQKIAAIAKSIGYKNASHFSVAYKKHYGVLPNQERGTNS